MSLCACKEQEIIMENIVPTTLFAQYNVISCLVMKLCVMEEWMREGVKGKTCAYQEKLTSMEIIVLECVHQFVEIMKYSVMELIRNNGHKDLAVLLPTFVWKKGQAFLEILALELAQFIVRQAKD